MFLTYMKFDPNTGSQMTIQAERHADEDYRELQVAGRTLQNAKPARIPIPHRLRAVSPDSPEAAALLIEDYWDEVAPHAKEWETRYAEHPAVLARLANRYGQLGRLDDERRCLEKYNRLAPARWSFERLAAIHRQQGHPELWRATLEEFLATPDDYTLDHAQVRVTLARSFMNRGEYQKALPYAEAAAGTGASWAMECAGRCNEGAGNLVRAESWFRADAERYSSSFLRWFLFCKRTGHGDVDSATRLADAFFTQSAGRLTENQEFLAVLFDDLADRPTEGAAFVRALPKARPPSEGRSGRQRERWLEQMFLARFADALNDPKLRDAAWDEVAKEDNPTAAQVAALFRKATDAARGAGFDRKAFDELITPADTATQSYLGYFAGRFLERHGTVEEAARCWERSVAILPRESVASLPARNALRARGLPTDRIPEDPTVYLLRGSSHRDAGRPDLALKDFEEAIRLDATNPTAFMLRAALHRSEDRPGPALKDFDEAIRLDPHRADAFNNRGVTRRAAGDLDGAMADFDRMVELAPNRPLGYVGRAVTLILRGDDDRARGDIDRAIAVAPQGGSGYVAKGLLSLARGQAAEAQELFQKALTLDKSLAPSIEQLKKAVKEKRPAPPPTQK
jgi:tetratricopeptide (TPR) repeat protein